jgi:hypothetical protein
MGGYRRDAIIVILVIGYANGGSAANPATRNDRLDLPAEGPNK